ncbi:hypothetical protein L1987_43548 [Smallanthus sonchifolius]|uniref:Uncharacterized protein n=1 Tax=Smallanthus sonchifolius TaxID=185202 RepID=A0ACB9GLD9_9ASTR|nr:hypothetical protein L1987_43548 [Smallanthus sonchifolius]
MMAFRHPQNARNLYQTLEIRKTSYLFGNWRTYSNVAVGAHEVVSRSNCHCLYKSSNCHHFIRGDNKILRTSAVSELSIFLNGSRSLSTQVKAPAQARQMGALKVSMMSPGIIYEPYGPREPISFLRRWFTRNGWRRTKDDIFLELKNAYAIAKLRKSGYSKQKFYTEAVNLYKEINTLMANGDKTSLRKMVTEQMYSALKSEIKQRESRWSNVYWELIEPVIKIRTLRARMIGVDRDDLSKVFIQLTLEFLSKQKFEAYDSKGAVVAGNRDKEVLVRDIWVFEKSQFHPGAYWHLCGRIPVKPETKASDAETWLLILQAKQKKRVSEANFFHSCASSPRTIPVLEDEHDLYGPTVQAKVHGMAKPFGSLSSGQEGEKGTGEVAKMKKTRKTVSINHEVEYIEDNSSNKKRKRKTMEQWPSMEIEGDEMKPLKSILKVGFKEI